MKDLTTIREEIDGVDKEIVALYEKRMRLTNEVAEYKISMGKNVLDRQREQDKLKKLTALAQDDFCKQGVRELFEHIMSISRKRQYQLLTEHGAEELPQGFSETDGLDASGRRIVFQGVEGAYAHIAMNTYFGSGADSFHVSSWREAMEAIKSGSAGYAVLPIENSTAGVVAENYDLLIEYDHYIVGEQIIPVNHCLLGLPDAGISDITNVYSHPQALAQCRSYLQAHGDWNCSAESNTAVAAQKVKDCGDKSRAAIASRLTAELYGLKVLESGIQTNEHNSTRFIIVSKDRIFTKTAKKVSICLEIKHESGTLYRALSHIIYNDLNMEFIQSRPLRGHEGAKWQYRFFIDFEGNLRESAVQNALRGLSDECENMRVLGNY